MKTIISIILVWFAIAVATAWFWYRLRRHEKYMESLLPRWGLPTEGDDTDSATFMGMDKVEEMMKAQLDGLPRPDCPDCSGNGYTLSDPDGKQIVCKMCEGRE